MQRMGKLTFGFENPKSLPGSAQRRVKVWRVALALMAAATCIAVYSAAAGLSGLPLLAQNLTSTDKLWETQAAFPHIRTATITYSTPVASIRQWQAARHDFFFAGPDPRSYKPRAAWVGYRDFQFIYITEAKDIKEHAASIGAPFEDYYLHMDTDYLNGQKWTRMDRFGNWENGKGVFTAEGGRFTDRTAAAYSGTPSGFRVTETLYVGSGEPFDEINLVLAEPRSGGSVTWQYWNGASWQILNLRSDTTANLSSDGKILFTPPIDWAVTAVNDSQSKWWVRASLSNTSSAPAVSRIYGDNWLTDQLSRGWAASNPGRQVCCGGGYEYDPGPPSQATARFRHQARVRSFFTSATDSFLMNHSAIRSGVRLWTRYVADRVVDVIRTRGYSGIVLDDGDAITEKITSPSDWRNHLDWNWPYRDEQTNSYREVAHMIHEAVPEAIVGANAYGTRDFALSGDFVMRESFVSSYLGEHTFSSARQLTFDDFLPANNPNYTKGILMVLDSYGPDGLDSARSGWYAWDRADRRPISALAFYYIGANGPQGNTYFHYNSLGFTYATTDEVEYYSDKATVLTADVPANTATMTKTITGQNFAAFPPSGLLKIGGLGEHISYTANKENVITFTEPVFNAYPAGTPVWFVVTGHQSTQNVPLDRVYRWTNWFPAMGVDVGEPDPNGHNRGLRDLAWRTGEQYGVRGGRPVWRRDYTKAIILLRAASTATPAARFNTYSQPLDLGGTYYRLHADGATEPRGITSIALREGEAAILMKQAINVGRGSLRPR